MPPGLWPTSIRFQNLGMCAALIQKLQQFLVLLRRGKLPGSPAFLILERGVCAVVEQQHRDADLH